MTGSVAKSTAEMELQQPKGSGDLGVASAVTALLAATAALVPGWAFLAVPIGVIALLLAVAALLLPGRRRSGALGGLVLGGIATGIAVVAVQGAGATPAVQSDDAVALQPAAPQVASTPPGDVTTITYEITTDGMSVTHLSYVDVVMDGSGTVDGLTMVEKLGVPPPFRHTVQLPRSAAIDLQDLSVTGMGGSSSRVTRCIIRVDGSVVATQQAEGAYGLVNCAPPAESTVEDPERWPSR